MSFPLPVLVSFPLLGLVGFLPPDLVSFRLQGRFSFPLPEDFFTFFHLLFKGTVSPAQNGLKVAFMNRPGLEPPSL